jgi:hypothetical protein
MPGSMRMFAGMTVWRTITAERDAALLARAQVNPIVADLYALRAFTLLRLFNRSDRVKMRAASFRHCF